MDPYSLVAGRTVAAGERAVVVIALFDLAVALAAVVLFWRSTPGLGGWSRCLATGAPAFLEVPLLGGIVVFTLLALNR